MEVSEEYGTPDYLQMTASLATEIAQQLSPPSEIFARAGLSKEDALKLLNQPEFQAMVKAAKSEWNAVGSTPERIKLKAQMALEELMLPQFRMAMDPKTPATARNDAFKSFERLAEAGKSGDGDAATGPKFVLNINLGEAMQLSGETIEGTPEEKLLDAS